MRARLCSPLRHRVRYSAASFRPGTSAGSWASLVTANKTVTPTNVVLATDAAGVAGNSVPVSYVSGISTDKIIFPEVYQQLEAMSICTVTRYTSATLNRARIFQPFKSTSNWLHGQWCAASPCALSGRVCTI